MFSAGNYWMAVMWGEPRYFPLTALQGKRNSWYADMSNWCLSPSCRLNWRDWSLMKVSPSLHSPSEGMVWLTGIGAGVLSLTSPCFLHDLCWPPRYCVHCRHWTQTEPQLCCSPNSSHLTTLTHKQADYKTKCDLVNINNWTYKHK